MSAIARHLERDRKTVRAYVRGERTAGVRRSAVPDPLEPAPPGGTDRSGAQEDLPMVAPGPLREVGRDEAVAAPAAPRTRRR